MKLSSTRPPGYFWIHWWLTNHCNYNCQYCADILKSGSITQVGLDDCLDFVAQASGRARQLELKLRIDLSGGEITGWYGLNDLLSRIKEYQGYASIRTNASQSLSDFSQTLQYLDAVTLDYHPEYASPSHYLAVMKLAASKSIAISANVNMLPEKWQDCDRVVTEIEQRHPSVPVNRRMLFQDPINNAHPLVYQPQQEEKLVRQHGDLVLETVQGKEFTDYQTLVMENKNQFTDWQCGIGLEQIIVDAYGRVRRGHCGVGGSMGTIGGPIIWDTNNQKCTKPRCANAFDIQATKIKSV